MFTLNQIYESHSKVKSGADFPHYIRDLIALGVTRYDIFIADGHGVYFGNPTSLISEAKYDPLEISKNVNKDKFMERLRIHQNGGTDYMTFCRDCAKTGIEKWTLNISARRCTYFDTRKNIVLVENFRS